MLQMCGAFAEFERSMLQARIAAGLRRAVANGVKLGRPLNDPCAIERARAALAKGIGINRVAKMVGLSNGSAADQSENGGSVKLERPKMRTLHASKEPRRSLPFPCQFRVGLTTTYGGSDGREDGTQTVREA